MSSSQERFLQIPDFPNYSVSNKGKVLNTKTKRYIGTTKRNGYAYVVLINGSRHINFMVHQLVMKCFGEEKPGEEYEIDHINHIRDDNRIENLRWVTKSMNNKNRTSSCGVGYFYTDEIDEDSIEIADYGNHKFVDYYYDENVDQFYYFTGEAFRLLHVNTMKRDHCQYVNMMNTNGKKVSVFINKFKQIYGIE